MCGGDAALCQITLTAYYVSVFHLMPRMLLTRRFRHIHITCHFYQILLFVYFYDDVSVVFSLSSIKLS